MTAEAVRRRASALVEAGAPWVSLRDHRAEETAFQAEAERLAGALRAIRPSVVLSVHGRLDAAVALGAGLHVGWRGASLRTAREAGVSPVGVSAHDSDEVRRAALDGADYATLSPVFPTRTHPEAHPLGLDALAEVGRVGVPVLALGGMTPKRAAEAVGLGAHGVAVLSGLLDAPDPAASVAGFLHALRPEPGADGAV